MESIFLMFSALKPTTLVKYLRINEFPLHPTGAFVLRSVSISETDGWRCEIVNMEVRLAVKLAVMIRIANNHGASTNRDKLLRSGSPACYKLSELLSCILGTRRDVIQHLMTLSETYFAQRI